MIKGLIIAFFAIIFFTGCGDSSISDDVNKYKTKNTLGYYDDLSLFSNNVITGFWIKVDKDSGIESMYYFINDKNVDINISSIDYFYDNENYGVDITGNKLSTYKFYKYSITVETNDTNETNVTTEYYDYNRSIIEYFNFKSVNEYNGCLVVSNYEVKNGNQTLSKDYDFCPNSSQYTQRIFATHSLVGLWVQYEYDENDIAEVDNALGIEFLYLFDDKGKVSMNISLIDTWIPLGKYSVDEQQTTLTYEEGSDTALKQFRFIEHRDPIPLLYKDENDITRTLYMPCLKIAKYNIYENNNTETFDKYYQLCKKQ